MAAYNTWMNERTYALIADIPDEQRRRDMGAFFGSIHRTLNHLLLGDQAWMQRLRGQAVTMTSPAQQLHEDFDELRAARAAMDADITNWAAQVDHAFMEGVLRSWSVTYQRNIEIPGWVGVIQMFNHQTHHRGQITTLMKQLGVDPGVTDFPWMPYFTAAQPA
jgi:uncharacterized damage-inducible protein DinB